MFALPKFKTKSDFNFYWNCIMRADEDAMQKTRPWQRLELIPTYDSKKLITSGRGECLHKDYVFGKKIDTIELENLFKSLDGLDQIELENLLKSIDGLDTTELENAIKSFDFASHKRIKLLKYPFAPMPLAKRIEIDPIFWKKAFSQAQLYLLGTWHGSRQSILDVQNLMRTTQPDIVFVELCKTRVFELGGLWTDEEIDKELGTIDEFLHKFIDKKHPGKKLNDFGWFQRRSLKRQAIREVDYMKKERDGEFRAAKEMSKKVPGCAGLVLGELPHSHVESVEILNSGNVLDYKEYNKQINEIVDGKRERHMTKVLHTILHRCTLEKLCASHRIGAKFEPLVVVGIVGWAHLAGIERIWTKPEEIYLQK